MFVKMMIKILCNRVSTRKKYFSILRDERNARCCSLIKTNVLVRSIPLNTHGITFTLIYNPSLSCLHPDRISVFVAVSIREKRYFLRKVVACFLTPRDKISSKIYVKRRVSTLIHFVYLL